MDPRRVLLLSAAMGGGHLQVSRELARRLSQRGHEVTVVDMLEVMPGPTGRWLAALYPWLVNRAPWLYDAVFRFFFQGRQRGGERVGVPVRLALPGLRRLISDSRPDAVVSTYHLAGLAAARLRREGALGGAAVTFNTTFGVHNLWLHPGTTAYLCITEAAAAETARRTGGRVIVCEPVVRPAFLEEAVPANEAREALGLPREARIALIVAGEQGMGRVEHTLAAIERVPGWTAVVVCGRNERLHGTLQAVDGALVYGWVDDMATLMAAADVVVDNAAGSSAKEALALGVPVVTFKPIAGHGRDDARAMARLGLTEIVDDERALPRALDAALGAADRVARGRALFGADPAAAIAELAARRA